MNLEFTRLKMNVHNKMIVSLFCLSASVIGHAAEFEDSARVLRVVERTEQVNVPQQECRTEYVQTQQRQERGVGGAIIGGVAGGLLGNQVGGGRGRTAATAAGAVVGALVGDRMENDNGNNGGVVTERPVQRCRNVDHWETRVNGYEVTYEYRGHQYTTVLPRDPGEHLRLHVSLTPSP
jgi:uncharacterized protein YcfJ